MLSWIRYRWKLYKAERQLSRINERWRKDIDAERKAGRSEEMLALVHHSASVEAAQYEDEIRGLETARICARAHRVLVPIPRPQSPSARDDDETWYWSHWVREPILKADARRALLKEIVKAERETRNEWCQWLAAITGVLGALIGVAAIVLE